MCRANRGAIAPLAILFTTLSLIFTLSYLTKVVTQHRLEKYRYAKKVALYVAEAGLNKVAMDYISFLSTDDTTLVDETGKDFPDRENEPPLGKYKNVKLSTPPLETMFDRAQYKATSTGVVEIINRTGVVKIERTVQTSFVPVGFEEFMYFTDQELPSGPPNEIANDGGINFGANDSLDGRVHTNGVLTLSDYGCPTFLGEVTVSPDGGVDYGNCGDDFFIDEDGFSILDTVQKIIFPPYNPLKLLKANATRIFEADSKIFNNGVDEDTLIMTEIEFTDNGSYRVKQWWYQIPPITERLKYPYVWDAISPGLSVIAGGIHLFNTGNNVQYDPNPSDDPVGYGTPTMIVLSDITSIGENLMDFIETELMDNEPVLIQSVANPDKKMRFTLDTDINLSLGGDHHAISIYNFNYSSLNNEGFLNNEEVELIFPAKSTGLVATVDFNDFGYWHDHPDDGVSTCRPDGFQHFDFPGSQGDPMYEVMPWTQFYVSRPEVIYVKGGQVLVHGIVDGRFSIVTDEYIEYRPVYNMAIVDVVWGNIWLIDDLTYSDSNPITGKVIQPELGGTLNTIGLIAGGNVIVANTTANGARDSMFGNSIKINAAIIASNEAFLSHYWQNTISSGACPNCANPDPNGIWFDSRGDGKGRNRNPWRDAALGQHPGTGNRDYRGTIYLWGSIVQQKRGYIKRNFPGPYTSGDIGYDKYYRYDYNLLENPPPFYPVIENQDGSVNLSVRSYGEVK